jgi:hypothetical protein
MELTDQTLCGWMVRCAQLLAPLYQRLRRFVLASKVVGTDDTPVKVLDRKLPQARKGRIWSYVGDRDYVAAWAAPTGPFSAATAAAKPRRS